MFERVAGYEIGVAERLSMLTKSTLSTDNVDAGALANAFSSHTEKSSFIKAVTGIDRKDDGLLSGRISIFIESVSRP